MKKAIRINEFFSVGFPNYLLISLPSHASNSSKEPEMSSNRSEKIPISWLTRRVRHSVHKYSAKTFQFRIIKKYLTDYYYRVIRKRLDYESRFINPENNHP